MEYNGFSKETFKFLTEIKANNRRDWFEKRKNIYRESVEAPAKELLAALTGRLGVFAGGARMNGKIFRFYRDLRTSQDKTPYNSNIRLIVHRADAKESNACARLGFYLTIEADRSRLGVGIREFDPARLKSYRAALADRAGGAELIELSKRFSARSEFTIAEPELKRAPRGHEGLDPALSEWIRRKGALLWHESKGIGEFTDRSSLDFFLDRYEKMRAFHDWLARL